MGSARLDSLALRPLQHGDIERLIEWSVDEAFLMQWAGPNYVWPLTPDQLQSSIGAPNVFAVHAEGSFVGHGVLAMPYATSGRLACLIVDPMSRGMGVGSFLVRELCRIAFEERRLHRVELGVFDFNADAIRCYTRCGFRIEGRHRETRRVGDEWWSTYTMAILEPEWFDRPVSERDRQTL